MSFDHHKDEISAYFFVAIMLLPVNLVNRPFNSQIIVFYLDINGRIYIVDARVL